MVAEIWYGRCQFAEVNQESGELAVQVYSHPDGSEWLFSYEYLLGVLAKAKLKLSG